MPSTALVPRSDDPLILRWGYWRYFGKLMISGGAVCAALLVKQSHERYWTPVLSVESALVFLACVAAFAAVSYALTYLAWHYGGRIGRYFAHRRFLDDEKPGS
jgi:hypothetical protein